MRKLLAAVVLLITTLVAAALDFDYKIITDNLQKKLKTHCSVNDSIASMANILDIAMIKDGVANADSLASAIYGVAKRAGDYTTMYEMIMSRTNLNSSSIDSLNRLLVQAKALPAEYHRDETVAFIEMFRNIYFNSHCNPKKRSEELVAKLQALNGETDDLYLKLVQLHAVCLHLLSDTKSDLLVQYFDDFCQLSEELPITDFALRTFIARQAAMAYSLAERPIKSLEADRRMLTQIDSLTMQYKRLGRPYRNFGGSRYHVYVRMLSNFEHLHPDEIQTYYDEAMKYAECDFHAHNSFARTPSPEIFYAVSRKDWPRVVELLRNQKYTPENMHRKPTFLRYLITAAQQTGDTDVLLQASLEYNKVLEQMLNSERHFSEPDVVCETYMLRRKHNGSPIKAFRAEEKMHHLILTILLIAIAAMLVLLFFLIRYYRNSRKYQQTISDANRALEIERRSLQKSKEELTAARDAAQKANQFKTDFIRVLSLEVANPLNAISEYSHLIVDCSDAESKPYLQQYARLVEHNANFINTVVSDIFHLSEIDNDTITLKRSVTDIPKLLELCIETMRGSLKPGVKMYCRPSMPDIETFTDSGRLQQILQHLIGNAVKFTESGQIVLDCRLDKHGKNVLISVTDTGIGIDPAHSHMIFERLGKVNRNEKGLGLGLPISRMLAHMLRGDIMLDSTYTSGARFIVTIPYILK